MSPPCHRVTAPVSHPLYPSALSRILGPEWIPGARQCFEATQLMLLWGGGAAWQPEMLPLVVEGASSGGRRCCQPRRGSAARGMPAMLLTAAGSAVSGGRCPPLDLQTASPAGATIAFQNCYRPRPSELQTPSKIVVGVHGTSYKRRFPKLQAPPKLLLAASLGAARSFQNIYRRPVYELQAALPGAPSAS